jgi:hypothetical protein
MNSHTTVSRLVSALLLATLPLAAQTWTKHIIDNSASGADGVRVADVNNDGWLDVVSGFESGDVVHVCIHPGPSGVRSQWPRVSVGAAPNAEDAVFCDLDGDGALDVVSSCEGTTRRINFHWAPSGAAQYMNAGAWETVTLPASAGKSWMYALPMQLDGVNGVDIVAGGKDNDLVWFESPAAPRTVSEWRKHIISSECDDDWTMGLYAADIDHDGDSDVVWTTRNGPTGGVRWLENPGPGASQYQPWTSHRISGATADYMFGDVGDIDADGLPDIVAPIRDANVIKLFRARDSGGDNWSEYSIPTGYSHNCKGAAMGDLDLDGRIDVAATLLFDSPEAAWYRNGGNPFGGTWSKAVVSAGSKKTDAPVLRDVDGDGDLDLLTTIETGDQIVWFENPTRDGAVAAAPLMLTVRTARPAASAAFTISGRSLSATGAAPSASLTLRPRAGSMAMDLGW